MNTFAIILTMQVISPLTGSHSTTIELQIPTSLIVEKYKMIGINIMRFFRDIEFVELRKCSKTGYRFYYPLEIFGDDEFYEDLQSIFPTYYAKRWEHTKSLEFLKKGDYVLEVGSGSGYFLSLLKKKEIYAEGLEFNQKAIDEGKKHGLHIDRKFLEELSSDKKETFNAVCSFQVLEHISNVKSYFESSLNLLKKGGLIIIGVPNNNPYIFKHDIYHTLNLPPHHSGLWNRQVFQSLQDVFPVKLRNISVEPLNEYKEWYHTQTMHYLATNKKLGLLLKNIPRPLYKSALYFMKRNIEGRNIMAVFEKS